MEVWWGWQADVVAPLPVVPLMWCCTSFIPANALDQAFFCDHLKSNINILWITQMKKMSCRHFFLGWLLQGKQTINWTDQSMFYVLTSLLWFVEASVAEAELGTLFVNAKEGKIICLILDKMGHFQPTTLIHCDNSTATGIADTVEKKFSWSLEIHYFWIAN